MLFFGRAEDGDKGVQLSPVVASIAAVDNMVGTVALTEWSIQT